MKITSILVLMVVFVVAAKCQDHPQTEQLAKLEVYLQTEKSHYKLAETIRVRVEMRNVGSHPILVGRELSTIANWPFSIWLRLVDSEGKYAQPVHAGFVDPPPRADLSAREGVLRWWTTLDPGCFYGSYVDFLVESVRPGRYKLQGEYYSYKAADAPMALSPSADSKQLATFEGKVQVHPTSIEIDPAD